MSTKVKGKVCLDCASVSKLRWLPCPSHSPSVKTEECNHSWNSLIFVHNGTARACHWCGHTWNYLIEEEL